MTTVTMKWTTSFDGAHSKAVEPYNVYAMNFLPEESREKRIEKAVSLFFGGAVLPALVLTQIIGHVKQYFNGQLFEAVAVFAPDGVITTVGGTTASVSIGAKLAPLIHMLQDLALPVGIVVSLWGLIEMIMGNIDSGKHKMKWAIIGFVGMFIIPEVFYTIKAAFGS